MLASPPPSRHRFHPAPSRFQKPARRRRWRTALKALLLAPLLVGCGSRQSRSSKRCEPVACRQARQQLVDLSHPLQPGMLVSPGAAPFRLAPAPAATTTAPAASGVPPNDNGPATSVELALDSGTHIDAPDPRPSVSQLPVDELMLEAVVIDVRARTKEQPDFVISVNDLEDWEASQGPIPIGSLVIANTGWHTRFTDATKYFNRDAEGVMHFPGFGVDAIQLLIERDVAAVGIDTLQLGGGGKEAAAKQLLAANKFIVENLANLDALPAKGSHVVIGLLPVVDAAHAPARIFALVPEPEPKTFGE